MSFNFNALSNEQINDLQNEDLLPEGDYSFTVITTEEQFSKSGNSMLKVRLKIVSAEHGERTIYDYLVNTPKMMFKIKHFCEAIGLEEQYSKGNFSANDCIDRSGKVTIGVQKGNAKPDGSGFYPDKNSVQDYVKSDSVVVKKAPAEDFHDDAIPF